MNGLSRSAVYGHLSKHQFDVSRRMTASFWEAPKITFVCTTETILYIRTSIMGICWSCYQSQDSHPVGAGSWFGFGESPSQASVHMCRVKLTLHLALGRPLWPNPNSDKTFVHHSLVWSQFDSRMCIGSKSGQPITEMPFWGFFLSFLRPGLSLSCCTWSSRAAADRAWLRVDPKWRWAEPKDGLNYPDSDSFNIIFSSSFSEDELF